MSLLDDARRLADKLDRGGDGPWTSEGRAMRCLGCDVDLVTSSHASDCPWLSMSKIVAALEAAERFVNAKTWRDSDAAEAALVAALKGEVVPMTEPVLTGSGP